MASEPLYSLQSDLRLARDLADMADEISVSRFRANDLVVSTKPDMTHVTDADQAVERALRGGLADSRPSDAILGEEYGTDGAARRQWIIDPIDGTANFVRGVPVWGTLIALAIDGTPVVGVVSSPALGRRWWAATGLGAYVDDTLGTPSARTERRIHVSQVSDLADASLSYGSLSQWDKHGRVDQLLALSRSVWRTRAYGDMWSYMMVAEGLIDIAGEYDLQPYDMAALWPIVQEAGGRFTSADGQDGPWHGSALATNGLLHDAVLDRLG
ncbi:histidinol-phosphatase [Planctomonas psychrotolerans]|uniref:histidinol-phosphatase n=1 Tax=Planctomonas psychrotolerans TaxID=2528712 RepID=UPI00123A2D1C|nr:histidinol-phosphatase [Planctomonas psychrotolerans]